MRLYLAGPMTGLVDFNHPAFETTAAKLRAAGYTVTSPTDNGLTKDAPWADHMRADIPLLLQCEGVALMDGWQDSRGSQLERHVAMSTGIWCMGAGAWLGVARAFFQPNAERQRLTKLDSVNMMYRAAEDEYGTPWPTIGEATQADFMTGWNAAEKAFS